MIFIIAAHDQKRGIGQSNEIPWYIPDDLRHFKDLTTGHPVIMGRKTYESIESVLGGPLPDRTNIVVSRSYDEKPGITVKQSIDEAIQHGHSIHDNIFIIGGAQVYGETVPKADRLYLTHVHETFECDAFFPEYSEFTQEIEREDREFEGLKYSFLTLEK